MPAPLKITLYGEDDAVQGEFSRSIVPWNFVKKANRLVKSLDEENLTDEMIDEIADLVVSIFGNRFTREQLDNGADMSEMMSVLLAVQKRATTLVTGNPTPPPAR